MKTRGPLTTAAWLTLLVVSMGVWIAGAPSAGARGTDHRVTPDNRPGSYTMLFGGTDVTHERCSANRHQQAEPAVAVDPARPQVIAAAAMDGCHAYRVPIGLAQAQQWMGYYRSTDAGRTWSASLMPGYPASGGDLPEGHECALQADPTMAFDAEGRLFVGGICFDNGYPTSVGVNDFHMGVAVFSEHGERLERVIRVDKFASREQEQGFNADKGNLAVDRTTGPHAGNIYMAWTHCTRPGFACLQGQYFIAVARSTDHGRTFEEPVLVPPHPEVPETKYADVAIGPDGSVYIAFRSGRVNGRRSFWLTRSTDGGKSFSVPLKVADVDDFDGAVWSDNATRNCGDGPFGCSQPYTFGPLNSTPAVAADAEGVHVVYSGRDPSGRSRVFMRHSDDGSGWRGPARLIPTHSSTHGHAWQPDVVSVDGALSVIFLDSSRDRGYDPTRPPGNTATGANSGPAVDAYAASSSDGGRRWRLSRLSTVANNQNYETHVDARTPWLGDYIYASAVPGGAFGVWPDARDVVPGQDRRAPNDPDGFDVHAPCDWNPNREDPIPPQLAPVVVDAYASPSPDDPCLAQGGLDVNVYGASLPHGSIDLTIERRARRRAGLTRRYRVRATALRAGVRRPVPRATLRYAGRRVRTGRRGFAWIRVRSQRRWMKVRATKPGLLSDEIRVGRRRR